MRDHELSLADDAFDVEAHFGVSCTQRMNELYERFGAIVSFGIVLDVLAPHIHCDSQFWLTSKGGFVVSSHGRLVYFDWQECIPMSPLYPRALELVDPYNVRTSVRCPVPAAAAAIAGETRWVRPPRP